MDYRVYVDPGKITRSEIFINILLRLLGWHPNLVTTSRSRLRICVILVISLDVRFKLLAIFGYCSAGSLVYFYVPPLIKSELERSTKTLCKLIM